MRLVRFYREVFYLVALVVLLYLIGLALSPMNKMTELNKLVEEGVGSGGLEDSLYNLPELTPLVKERSYLISLLELSRSDSIQMSIDCSDSTVCLYIKGLKIHQSKFNIVKEDRFFARLTNTQINRVFSQPLLIRKQTATIVKEPVVERLAPKDTAEAALTAWKPDTLMQNPAFLWLELDYGLDLILEQERNITFHDQMIRTTFYGSVWAERFKQSLSQFLHFKKQDYHPTLKIAIPVDDLRSIYRALPNQSNVAMKI